MLSTLKFKLQLNNTGKMKLKDIIMKNIEEENKKQSEIENKLEHSQNQTSLYSLELELLKDEYSTLLEKWEKAEGDLK